ncbi:MAG: peptidylprolyl isomerase [Pseudomonadota bacterium]
MILRTVAATAVALGLVGLAQAEDAEPEAPEAITIEAAKTDSDNWRPIDPENILVFETTKGRILIEVLPDVAPKHAEQFKAIVRSGLYEGTVFHRVIDDFMAQGGDIRAINGEGSGLPNIEGEFTFRRVPEDFPLDLIGPENTATQGYHRGFPIATQSKFLAEMTKDGKVESWVLHCKGVVSTARTADPNSANSQFFLMRGVSPHLDKQYTAWGRILEGQDVVDTIKTGEPVRNPDVLLSAAVASDMPEGERPAVWSQRTDGPVFQETLAAAGETPICDLPPVPTVVEG